MAAPVSIHRMPDGRHAVMDEAGNVMGKHNSVFSAARQIHEYFGPTSAANEDIPAPVEPGDVQPAREAIEAKGVGSKQSGIMERPKIPKPPKDRPAVPHPTIPKP